jgi:transcriptional regulator with GAF, ATPase, and Fis domain
MASDPPQSQPSVSTDVRDLSRLVAGDRDVRAILERALAALEGVIPFDLAAVFRLFGNELRVLAAAGRLDRDAVRRHKLDLRRFPTIQRALESRRPIPLEEHHHASHEGDPYDGVLDLPEGHSCMVIPLFAGDRNLGIITLDRQTCGRYDDTSVQIASVYGQLISLAILFADQAEQIERYRRQLAEENALLVAERGAPTEASRMLEGSASPAMEEVVRLARQVAPADLPVLLLGETGTGKEVLAKAIHGWSRRAGASFITLNCSAIPDNLVESELFGHVKGAFTGADRPRRGRFATADGGTLLLDEIGDMPLMAQSKLLRVLQEGVFEPVGSDEAQRVDVRVVAATHVDLPRAVAEGRFRQDLYFRLAVFPLTVPPLRERPEDIGRIALDFLDREARRTRRGPWTLPDATLEHMQAAPWPGNVRELLNALERATILQPAGAIEPRHLGLNGPSLPAPTARRATSTAPLPSFAANERAYLQALLDKTGGKLYGADGAAKLSGLNPSTLRSKLVKHGLR